jgi:hypothetical protein
MAHPLQSLVTDGKDSAIELEYIVTYDVPQIGERSPIAKGTIVNNVKRNIVDGHHHGYIFTIKETGEESITMYPWALAVNNIANKAELETYWAMQKQVKVYQRLVTKQGQRLQTLQ